MNIEDEMHVLFELKELCKLYINQSHTNENPVMLNANKLLTSVKERLSHFCTHTIIEDVIEIGEITKTIYYCSKCETTFNPKN